MTDRHLIIAFVEKRNDEYGIWPEMSTPFSLSCVLFGDRKPQRSDSLCEGEALTGTIWNGRRILGNFRVIKRRFIKRPYVFNIRSFFSILSPEQKAVDKPAKNAILQKTCV